MIAQIALSMVLLTGAGMLLDTLASLLRAPLGFDPDHTITASFILGARGYANDASVIGFFERLEERANLLPGVRAAAITDSLPPDGDPRSRPFVALRNPGGDAGAQGMSGLVFWRYVTPGYFDAMGIPIARGRGFLEEDRLPSGQAVILNGRLAARLFPGEDPLLRRIGEDLVVGVAQDARNAGIAAAPAPEMYYVRKHGADAVYRNQRPPYGWRRASLVLRASGNEAALASAIRELIHGLDASIPVDVSAMREQTFRALARPRFQAMLLSMFAAVALAIAAAGLFGLISFLLAGRVREMGIRIALGSSRAALMGLIWKQTLGWALAGILVGALASLWAFRWMESLLVTPPAANAWMLAPAALLIAMVTAAAAGPPAWRAARTQPADALRSE